MNTAIIAKVAMDKRAAQCKKSGYWADTFSNILWPGANNVGAIFGAIAGEPSMKWLQGHNDDSFLSKLLAWVPGVGAYNIQRRAAFTKSDLLQNALKDSAAMDRLRGVIDGTYGTEKQASLDKRAANLESQKQRMRAMGVGAVGGAGLGMLIHWLLGDERKGSMKRRILSALLGAAGGAVALGAASKRIQARTDKNRQLTEDWVKEQIAKAKGAGEEAVIRTGNTVDAMKGQATMPSGWKRRGSNALKGAGHGIVTGLKVGTPIGAAFGALNANSLGGLGSAVLAGALTGAAGGAAVGGLGGGIAGAIS